ncbi:BZ3500_MvSof-1268-A1-R1_Chr3-3g06394 [Microbotryum saponariae]|uniref:Condensin complex subunit 2 n=1 Tax=Microbotryum saponariae TaxID=289078 RepID=A0A2X0KV09_9BASI|nr:BZ3500_MvSof-1268-A1-R1_Chr3-3g06394 [Microbotryum saponariae]SDA04361.1 BZ3501_MvSof-1269-A2-R1_Chr3-2g06081 [Microbotryum saponariae]
MAPLQERSLNTGPRRSSLLATPTKDHSNDSSPQLQRHPQNKHGKIAALAAANRLRDASAGSSSAGAGGPTTPQAQHRSFSAQLQGVAPPPAPLVVESQRYEEWMKIATDNKITSTNTWSLALIDYFADMSLLRNNDDNSINFQKASCTLDGCVKIWTSRVDSVATETGKLLSGLAEDGRNGSQGVDDDDDMDNDEDEDAREARKAKRKNAKRAETLADSFNKIKVKAFDLEFTVDPLFKKTCADFDEGGAGGILMNHLGCDRNMKVVFDAGDARLDKADDDDDDDEDDEDDVLENEDIECDLTRLTTRCFPDGLDTLEDMVLCPSLASFRFSPDANLDLGILQNPDNDDEELAQLTQRAALPGGRTGGDNAHDNELNGQDYGFDDQREFGGSNDNDDGGADGAVDFFADEPGAGRPFDPSRDDSPGFMGGGQDGDGGELVMSMENGSGDGHLFDLLDAGLSKNWAGPEHWKMRRLVQRKPEDETAAKQRKEKVTFAFDFTQPPPIAQKELFASAPTPASIRAARKSSLAPKTAGHGKRNSRIAVAQGTEEEQHILPDDFHFNSQILLRLFLKPKLALKLRRRGNHAPGVVALGGGEADAHFWAGAGANLLEDDHMGGVEHDFEPSFGGDYAVPFDTQILNDGDDDLPYFNEDEDDSPTGPMLDGIGLGGGLDESDDILQDTQGQLKRVRPENINYAKRAKRVDVAKLKDSIWTELQVVSIPVKEFPTEPVYQPDLIEPTADESNVSSSSKTSLKPETLVPVVDRLRKTYPKDKMEEISTSFCFICLLHLANEKGLRIQTPGSVEDEEEGDEGVEEGMRLRKRVGGLEALRVFRTVE